MSMISRIFVLLVLSGCAVNIPVLGPSVTDDELLQDSYQVGNDPNNQLSLKGEHDDRPREVLEHHRGIDFYKWAALKGHVRAYVVVGDYFLTSSERNETEAISWLKKGVEKKDIACTMRLAKYYVFEATPANYLEAEELLAPFINDEYIPALRLAAHIAEKNSNTAQQISYLNKARQLGDLDSAHRLEKVIMSNKSSYQLPTTDESDSPYQELDDLKDFWHETSEKYLGPEISGLTTRQSDPSSKITADLVEILQIASSQNSQYASFILANYQFDHAFKSSKDSGALKDKLELAMKIPAAKSLYARAIFQGKVDSSEDPIVLLEEAAKEGEPYALLYLSLHYRFQKKDFVQSTKYYYKGLEEDLSLRGRYNVALDLLNEHLPMSHKKTAYEWLLDLAAQNYPDALLKVAELKEDNKILSQSNREIFMHRARAAYMGSAEGCYQVGNMYLKGFGVKPDLKKAFIWFNHAARVGYQPAQYQLSLMYKNGIGVIEDPVKSYAWFSLLPTIFEQQQGLKEDLTGSMSQQQLDASLKMSQILRRYYSSQIDFKV